MEHLEWPKELCLQLAVPLGLDELAIQPNLLAGGVAPRLDSLIMGSLLKFLGMVEVLATYDYQLSELLGYLVRRLGLGAGIDFLLVRHPRMVAAVQLQRCVAGASILGVVVCELRH